jgi:hypothetical protein
MELRYRDAPAFALAPRYHSDESRGGVGRQASDYPLFCFSVEDCRRLYAKLRAMGANLDGDVGEAPGQLYFSCDDPFGNRLYFYEDLPAKYAPDEEDIIACDNE